MHVPDTYRPRIGVYTRLSIEAASTSTSLDGQSAALYAIAERDGYDVVMERQDNGLSGGKERANAVELLDALRAGTIDVLGVASFDRWTRMGIADAAKIIEVVTERNDAARRRRGRPALFIAEREGIRSDVEGWELRLAFAADLARMERERIAARVAAARARLRSMGRWHGGTPTFGYRVERLPHGGSTLRLSAYEAEVIRDIARRALAEESVVSIARSLTAAGVARPRSEWRKAYLATGADPGDLPRGTWTASSVRQTLTSPALLGRLIHDGQVVLDDDGVPLAAFPEVVDLVTHQRLLARFPGRGHAQTVRRAARLLSGVLYCAGCGRKLHVAHNRGAAYRCSALAAERDCPTPALSIDAGLIEPHVVDVFLARVGRLDELERVETTASPVARLAEVRSAIADAAGRLSSRTADRVALLARLDQLQAEEEALEALPAATRVEWRRTGRTISEAWEAAQSDRERRQLLTTWIDHIAVAPPAMRGRPRPVKVGTRIAVEWVAGVEEALADVGGGVGGDVGGGRRGLDSQRPLR